MSFSTMYQEVVNMSDSEKITLAQNAFVTISKGLAAMDIEDDAYVSFILSLSACFAGADRLVTAKEYALFATVTGLDIDFESFYNMVCNLDSDEIRESLDSIIDDAGGDFKDACLCYGLAFMSIDDKISTEEQAFFEKIWG